MKNIIQKMKRPTTVDEIVKNFSQMLDQLNELSAEKQAEAEALDSQIEHLEKVQEEVIGEKQRADNIASKLKTLLF